MADDSSVGRLAAWLRAEAHRLGPGSRLPTSRQLVAGHRVSPVTVARALGQLDREGLLVRRGGVGTFVAAPPNAGSAGERGWQSAALGDRRIDTTGLSPLADPPHDDAVVSLASGYLHDSLQPVRALGAALGRAARRTDCWDRAPVAGLHGLRTWFARTSATGVEPRDVLVTSGGQSALSAAFRAVAAPGGVLLVESPTYPGALAAARAAGLRPVPVPTDADGVRPDALAEAFGRTGASAFYCQPAHANPTGTVLAASRRAGLLEVACAAGAFLVEDDFARFLGHRRQLLTPLLAADRDGRVIYVSSLTKAASPGLRVGALIARGPVAERLLTLRVVEDLFIARPLQEAALELISGASWERHLSRLGHQLRNRCAALGRAVSAALPQLSYRMPTGGMHLWARLPDGVDDVEVSQAARRAGVAVMAGRPFFPAEPTGPHLRLTFSAAADEASLIEGITRLRAVLERATGS